MKILSVIQKCFKEQIRQPWILALTLLMAPFFIFVYFLIIEASKASYDLIIVNRDIGVQRQFEKINHGEGVIVFADRMAKPDVPLSVKKGQNMQTALQRVKSGRADALIVVPADFSRRLDSLAHSGEAVQVRVKFIGDFTSVNYMIAAVWAHEMLNEYVSHVSGRAPLLKIDETAVGGSAQPDDFNSSVPGLLILSIVMLMFTASIALVTEVENRTILRLKLSKLSGFEFLAGVSVVQIALGLVSIVLTLATAVALGFEYSGSLLLLLFIAALTSISIVAFSMILAAATKTVNEILIIGNFPLFLFMFFTGVAFPVNGKTLFSIAGYAITLPGFMSPNHAVSALKKILIMNMGLHDVLPEIIALIVLSVIYFLIGIWGFQKRHMRVQ